MALEQIIAAWGPPAVLAGCFFEGETAAIIGGMIAHRGLEGWAQITALAALGAFSSDQMWFWLSRHATGFGPLRRFRERAAHSKFSQKLNSQSHMMAFLFRFIPGARIAGPILLAQTDMPHSRFLITDGLAVCAWSLLWTTIGYHFGYGVEALFGHLHGHHWLWLLAGVAVVAGIALHLIARHNARPPGPGSLR